MLMEIGMDGELSTDDFVVEIFYATIDSVQKVNLF